MTAMLLELLLHVLLGIRIGATALLQCLGSVLASKWLMRQLMTGCNAMHHQMTLKQNMPFMV